MASQSTCVELLSRVRGSSNCRCGSQRVRKADDEQEHEHMKGHHDPRRLKWGALRALVKQG